MRRPKLSQHAALLGLAVLVAPGLALTARAQHTPDPYNIVGEYNLGYENYMYPTYPNGAGFTPNQGILQSRAGYSRANQFRSYVEELDGVGSSADTLFGLSPQVQGGTAPYYRAHRQFDEAFNRVYAPNEVADKTYTKNQQARTEKYLEYLRESDPTKRAQLYREYNQLSRRAARDFGPGPARAALRGDASERSSAAPIPAPRSSATPTPGMNNLLRRPSRLPSSSRTRGAATSTIGSETPEQILERANRAAAPTRVPNRSAPASATAPR
jgi:hypothetical protein